MKKLFSLLLFPALLCLIIGCSSQSGLVSRVSEYRSVLYTAEADGASLQASFSEREYPYAADGSAAEKSDVFEVRATLPDNTLTYRVSFETGGKPYEGEMNYDSVKQQFTFSVSLSAPQEKELAFTVSAEGEDAPSYTFAAKRTEGRLSLSDLLSTVSESQKDELADFAGENFDGEIYVRLLMQGESRYYYVGFIDRSGNCLSFLADADTGEVLATKKP